MEQRPQEVTQAAQKRPERPFAVVKVPPSTHYRLKVRAVERGERIGDYVTHLLDREASPRS